MTRNFLSREELYDMVWSQPKTAIAKQLGVSDVAVGKACRKAGIPIPGPGYWAKKQARRAPNRTPLASRFPGASNTVRVGGCRWDSPHPSDSDLLNKHLPPPPNFPEGIDALRGRVIQMVGRVPYPQLSYRMHPVIQKLLEKDEEKPNEHSNFQVSWNAPRFSSSSDRRRLRILNAIFLTMDRIGCRVAMPMSRYEPKCEEATVYVGDQHIHFQLAVIQSKPRRSHTKTNQKSRLRLAITSATDSQNVFHLWEDHDDSRIESNLKGIVVEIIMCGEIQYREREQRLYHYLIRRRIELKKEILQQIVDADRHARELREQKERERIERLLAEASALQQAQTIRDYVASIRNQGDKISAPVEQIERWASWALAQADRIDPARNCAFMKWIEEK